MLKKKIIRKIAEFLTWVMFFNQVVTVGVFAQEVVVEPTPTETQEPAAVIDTGDAQAEATTETVANTNISETPGEVVVGQGECPSVEIGTECPNGVDVENNNNAEVVSETDAAAATGTNETTNQSGDVVIATGDATASGEIDNTINTNVVEFVPASESAQPESVIELVPEPEINIENNNLAVVDNDAEVSADTGDNKAVNNAGDALIVTGDATAVADVLNVVNTNVTGSNFQVLKLEIVGETDEDVDLNAVWDQLLNLSDSGDLVINGVKFSVVNSNEADIFNTVRVNADTGENLVTGNEDTAIVTGDASAVANVGNIVNSNILGSKFFWGYINILAASKANIILPRPEKFLSMLNSIAAGEQPTIVNQNAALIDNQITAGANTGENSQAGNAGDNLAVTGEAQAVANSVTLANLNLFYSNWFWLLINNLGGWTGSTVGWTNPESSEMAGLGSTIYNIGGTGESGESGENSGLVANRNLANIYNDIVVTANTGKNSSIGNNGNSAIFTGNARALANLYNLANMNIVGSNWFMGTINILGGWGGNMIFAYPDLVLDIEGDGQQVYPGRDLVYKIHYRNNGYDLANQAKVKVNLPADTSSSACPGNVCEWNLGNLTPKQEGVIEIIVNVNPGFHFETPLSWLWKLVPGAKAADLKSREIQITGQIFTIDPEYSKTNNQASVAALVHEEPPITGSGVGDQRQPVLEIAAKNNVVTFVNPGDTATFEIVVKNTSDTTAYDGYLTQDLFDQDGNKVGQMDFKLGEIPSGKRGVLSFGLKVPGGAPAGYYKTSARAHGKAPNGNGVDSNWSDTNFRVKGGFSLIPGAAAAEEGLEEVLGEQTMPPICKEDDVWPYIALFGLSSWLGFDRLKKLWIEIKSNQ